MIDVLTECLLEGGGDMELQRYCIDIVAQFAAMKDNKNLQDSVVDGPLKIIVTMMIDPMNDRDFRQQSRC
jgi:DNA-binding FrmR family transcriptional regulator